mmetsp:Transcript_18251/g.45131  ORF Transcript_18251/g.45131 Transcript_18251/m.45131 type:complete len:239 (+) Transcript_18251:176-892(+)
MSGARWHCTIWALGSMHNGLVVLMEGPVIHGPHFDASDLEPAAIVPGSRGFGEPPAVPCHLWLRSRLCATRDWGVAKGRVAKCCTRPAAAVLEVFLHAEAVATAAASHGEEVGHGRHVKVVRVRPAVGADRHRRGRGPVQQWREVTHRQDFKEEGLASAVEVHGGVRAVTDDAVRVARVGRETEPVGKVGPEQTTMHVADEEEQCPPIIALAIERCQRVAIVRRAEEEGPPGENVPPG